MTRRGFLAALLAPFLARLVPRPPAPALQPGDVFTLPVTYLYNYPPKFHPAAFVMQWEPITIRERVECN